LKPASHDRRCRVCGGTGWETGAGIPGHSNGKAFEYTTLQPCTNQFWWGDDPTVDEYGLDTTIPITLEEYLQQLVARGDWVELDRWHHLGSKWGD
jgi:hypothetical protein